MSRYLLLVVSLMLLTFCAGCQVAKATTALGVQDDGRTSAAVLADTDAIDGSWTRTTVALGSPLAAQRIRDAHAAGKRIILTIGGTGTGPKDSATRKPSAKALLAYIRSLPRADKYTVVNEPDQSGMTPCAYRYRWMKVRRALGPRLLYGDFSPHAPLSYTAAVLKCGRLPHKLDFAIHPYQTDDPLRPTGFAPWSEGCMGCLGHVERALRGMGIKVAWWIDEFGYGAKLSHEDIDDERAARLWPRAVQQAKRVRARVLIVYTSKGASWNTRPGPLAWCSLMRGRACAGERPAEHVEPGRTTGEDEGGGRVRQMDPIVQQMVNYAAE